MSGLDDADYRAALGGFVTGVTVICARDAAGRRAGFTASSFAAVSLDPPLALFCLGRDAPVAEVFLDAASFAVSILRAGQGAIADRFASRAADPFEGVAVESWDAGAPILAERLGAIECDVERVMDGGDHHIFLGRVRRVDWDAAAEPLAYFRGRYRGLAPDG